MKKLLVFGVSLLLLAAMLLATDTAALSPTSDGSLDSASFFKTSTSGSPCSTNDCSTAVNESSGASCSSPVASDGDTSYVYSATNGAKQSFVVDVSGIPDGNQIESVNVYTCAKRGATGDSARLLTTINGGEYDCSTTFAPGASYAAANCAIPISPGVVKNGSTAVEIGVGMTANKGIYFSRFAAIVSYSAPGAQSKRQTIIAQSGFRPAINLGLRPAFGPAFDVASRVQ